MSNSALPKNAPLITLLVTQAGNVVLQLLAAFGVSINDAQVQAIGAAVSFLGIILALVLWAFTVSAKQVVEKLLGDESTVVAGPANERVAQGDVVRRVDSFSA